MLKTTQQRFWELGKTLGFFIIKFGALGKKKKTPLKKKRKKIFFTGGKNALKENPDLPPLFPHFIRL